MPSFRINPTDVLRNLRDDYEERLREAGILDLIGDVLSELYQKFLSNDMPKDPLTWCLERCGVPAMDKAKIKALEKERDELLEEVLKYDDKKEEKNKIIHLKKE